MENNTFMEKKKGYTMSNKNPLTSEGVKTIVVAKALQTKRKGSNYLDTDMWREVLNLVTKLSPKISPQSKYPLVPLVPVYFFYYFYF